MFVALFFLAMALTPEVWAFHYRGEISVPKISTVGNFNSTGEIAVTKPEIQIVIKKEYIPVPATDDTKTYTVEKGDTLSHIAWLHDTKIEVLMALNQAIKNPNKIFVGQTIQIPAPYAETKVGKLETTNAKLETAKEEAEKKAGILEDELETAKAEAATATENYNTLLKRVRAFLKEMGVNDFDAVKKDVNQLVSENIFFFGSTIVFALLAVVLTILLLNALKKLRSENVYIKCSDCGEMVMYKNWKRHQFTRCPNRKNKKVEVVEAEIIDADAEPAMA